MATHSSILAWRIPPDRGAWQATVHAFARVRHDLATRERETETETERDPKNKSINSSVLSFPYSSILTSIHD